MSASYEGGGGGGDDLEVFLARRPDDVEDHVQLVLVVLALQSKTRLLATAVVSYSWSSHLMATAIISCSQSRERREREGEEEDLQERLPPEDLRKDAPHAPDVDRLGVVFEVQQLRRAVPPRDHVRLPA